jgi:hypothetical protein
MIKFYLIQKMFISFHIPQNTLSPSDNGIQETVRVRFQLHSIEKIEGSKMMFDNFLAITFIINNYLIFHEGIE